MLRLAASESKGGSVWNESCVNLDRRDIDEEVNRGGGDLVGYDLPAEQATNLRHR